MHPCARSNVEHIIRLANSLFVMLNNDDGISLIAKVFERGQKPVIVPLVQADAWLIQHIKHALKPGADLAGKANPLALATRKRARIARQGQIFEPDIIEKPKPFTNFFQDRPGNRQLLFAQLLGYRVAPLKCLFDRHLHHLPGMQARNFHRQSLSPQPIPAAGAAGAVVLIALKFFADPIAVSFAVAALHIGDDTLKAAGHLIHPPGLVVAKQDFFLTRSVKKYLLYLFRQVFPFRRGFEVVMFGNRFNRLKKVRRFAFAPGGQGSIGNLQGLIRHHKPLIKEQFNPQPVALRTGTKGRVKGEQTRLNFRDGKPRYRTGEFFAKRIAFGRALRGCSFKNGNAIGQI